MLDQHTDLKSLLKDPSLLVEAAYLGGEWVQGDEGTFDAILAAAGESGAPLLQMERATRALEDLYLEVVQLSLIHI